jgi:hypothetical protein
VTLSQRTTNDAIVQPGAESCNKACDLSRCVRRVRPGTMCDMEQVTTTLDPTAVELPPRELAYRRTGTLDIFLLWRPGDDGVTVRVEDLRTGVRIELEVDGRFALQAFDHPFSYAP